MAGQVSEVDGSGMTCSDGQLDFPEFVQLVASATVETASLAGAVAHIC